jgi:RNA polymerase sigma-70 factor (ECF subfamily)
MHLDDEQALLERVARRDAGAFEALYDRYGRSVYSVAMGMLRDAPAAEEVTQDVFLSLWRTASDFDARRGAPRTWILALAHHKAVDAVRRRRVRAFEPLSESMVADADVAALALRAVEGARVREALGALSDAQRQALTLAYYEGLTQQQIAARLGVPLGTIKTRMRDGMLKLRDHLGPQMVETGL